MALRVRITRRAKQDITEIKSFISQRDVRAAERVRQSINRAIDLLRFRPLIGVATNVGDVHVKLVPPRPLKIYYRVSGDEIVILHVRHTAREEPGEGEIL